MTGKEILEAEFEKSGMRGYRADQVDVLLQSAAEWIDKQNEENKDLTYKVKILADKIEEYKKDEESIRDALLGAQKMGSSILNEAKAKAETITRDAKQTSDQLLTTSQTQAQSITRDAKMASESMMSQAKAKIESLTKDSLQKANAEIAQIRKEIEQEQKRLDTMKYEIGNFRSSILKQYKTHLELLTNLPIDDAPPVNTQTSYTPPIQDETIKQEEASISAYEAAKLSYEAVSGAKEEAEVAQKERDDAIADIEKQEMASEVKQQTKEFGGRRKVVDVTECVANQEKEKPAQNSGQGSSQRTNFAAKYGELDFGNHNK